MPRSALSSQKDSFFTKKFIHEKLNNPLGYTFFILFALGLSALIVEYPLVGLGVFGGIVGLAIALACFMSVEAGLYINIIYSFFAYGISRIFFNDLFPIGIVLDIIIFTTFFGMFTQKINLKKNLNDFIRHDVAIWIIILLLYLFIELFNPSAKSFDGWYQSFRRTFESCILFFIAYNAFKSAAILRRFIITLFIFCTLVGLYGCVQQWHGLLDPELYWVMSDPGRFGLIFIAGDFRKFSTTSDPTAFGILMSSGAIFFSVLTLGIKKISHRLVLFGGIIIMILGMAYSGTRTANAMLVGGLGMYAMLDFGRKSTRIFAIVSAVILLVIIYGPFYSNATINRFRSTFQAKNDESYLVRDRNRKFIQPYIYSHPIGGGLGTTDENGKKFNPGHYLAGFPTDSGYLKKALETGWIGLAIVCVVYFIVLRKGIRGYFKSKNPRDKVIFAASTCCIFTFYVAEFPQSAVGQITDIIVYYPLLAVLMRAGSFENKEEITTEAAT